MQIFSSFSSFSRKILPAALSVLIAFGASFTVPARAAVAAPPDPGSIGILSLTKFHKRIGRSLVKQQKDLVVANGIVPTLQNLISAAELQGIESGNVADALSTFEDQLATATDLSNNAAAILATHAGFDVNGKVIDEVAAKQTITTATQAVTGAQAVLLKATSDLQAVVGAWVRANPLIKQLDALQQAFANKQVWLQNQQNDYAKAAAVQSKINDLIALADAKGISTFALTKALTTFQTQLGEAQSSTSVAEDLISSHPGFDADGNVTNLSTAADTILTSWQALVAAQTALKASSGTLLHSMNVWKLDKGIKSKSPLYDPLVKAQNAALDFRASVIAENSSPSDHILARIRGLLASIPKEI
jgi:hypothetical protein